MQAERRRQSIDQRTCLTDHDPFRIDQPEGVHTKAFHVGVAARQRAIAHEPHQHMGAFGRQGREIPKGVVRRLRLRNLVVRLGLHRMNQIRELDGILDEEDQHVVADEIPDSVMCRTSRRSREHRAACRSNRVSL